MCVCVCLSVFAPCTCKYRYSPKKGIKFPWARVTRSFTTTWGEYWVNKTQVSAALTPNHLSSSQIDRSARGKSRDSMSRITELEWRGREKNNKGLDLKFRLDSHSKDYYSKDEQNLDFFLKKNKPWDQENGPVGKTVHSVNMMSWVLIPHHSYKKQVQLCWSVTPTLGVRNRWILRVHWPASLAKTDI